MKRTKNNDQDEGRYVGSMVGEGNEGKKKKRMKEVEE